MKLALQEWGELESDTLLKEAFRVFDIRNCGTLAKEEVTKILVGSGDERLSPEEGKFSRTS